MAGSAASSQARQVRLEALEGIRYESDSKNNVWDSHSFLSAILYQDETKRPTNYRMILRTLETIYECLAIRGEINYGGIVHSCRRFQIVSTWKPSYQTYPTEIVN